VPNKATSFDIAQAAGVSQPTVSRALRGSPTVSEQTRKRIEAIAAQLNYKVDVRASNLRTGGTGTLALLFFEDPTPDESLINPFFFSMLGSITRTCARKGYALLTSFQQLSANWHLDYEDSRRADGIILLGYGDYQLYRDKLDRLVEQGTHFVRWGNVTPDQPGTTIGSDNEQGGYLAAEHLIKSGRKNIAFLGDISDACPELQARYRGACAAMQHYGLTIDPALQVDALTVEDSGHRAARDLIARDRPFDAVFAASDFVAIGAMGALMDHGYDIPGDVALIGFDDVPAARMTSPALTTIAQDTTRAGQVLVEALLAQVTNQPFVGTPVLPTKLIVRSSCGGAA
jgi:DNA-binding LacI/PurR family transcriptional regulator